MDHRRGYEDLGSLAQDAGPKSYIFSEQLWEDIDLKKDEFPKIQVPCTCRNPFCDNHLSMDDDLSQEWASMDQNHKRNEKPTSKPSPWDHPMEPQPSHQKSTAGPSESPKTTTVSQSTRNSTLWLNRRTRARDDLLLLVTAPPLQCDSPYCPLNQAPYHVKHAKGPYVHNGQSLSLILAGHVSKYLISIIDEFGGSLPPLGIWQAYERMAKGKAGEGDSDIVIGFFRSHCTTEASERLLQKLGRL